MRFLATTMIAMSTLLSLPAWAGHGHHPRWAKVVRSTPVYESFRVVTPQRECWSEVVVFRKPHHHEHQWIAPVVIGAVIGAAIARELGHAPPAEQVGAVAGVVLGATFGQSRHGSFRRRHGRMKERHEEVCAVREVVSLERRLVGYEVEYRYRGRVFHTRTELEPGSRIRVARAAAAVR